VLSDAARLCNRVGVFPAGTLVTYACDTGVGGWWIGAFWLAKLTALVRS
jgi:hypothetical protein